MGCGVWGMGCGVWGVGYGVWGLGCGVWAADRIDRAGELGKNGGMLILLFGAVVFAFLCVGAVVFLVCVAVPPTRKYALSAALWCAVWGPCTVGWMVLAGAGLAAKALLLPNQKALSVHSLNLVEIFGWTYLCLGVAVTAVVATGIAWLHQVLVRRSTLALFRLYAAVVCGGIGSVFGWMMGWWIGAVGATGVGLFLWMAAMLWLIAGFGWMGYRFARNLRGDAPTRFTWITKEEYLGIDAAQMVNVEGRTKRFWR